MLFPVQRVYRQTIITTVAIFSFSPCLLYIASSVALKSDSAKSTNVDYLSPPLGISCSRDFLLGIKW